MVGKGPYIRVDGHAVVVQNHDQRLTGGSGIVEPLIRESAGECAVSNQG